MRNPRYRSEDAAAHRWLLVALAVVVAAAATLWWLIHDPGGVAGYRLDAAALRALPADAAGDQRLLQHLGSLTGTAGDGRPWTTVHGATHAVLVVLTFDGMAGKLGLSGYGRFVQQGPPVPGFDEVAAAYRDIGCPDTATVVDEAQHLVEEHAWPPSAAQAAALEQRMRTVIATAVEPRRAYIIAHAAEIAAGK